MPQTPTGYRKPVFKHPQESRCAIYDLLPRNFDNIPEAEGEAVGWVLKGHVIETDVPRNS